MSYKVRPGITLVQICDTFLLVAQRSVWEEFPKIRPIPRRWAACWRIMEQGNSEKEAVRAFAGLLRRPEEEIWPGFEPIFRTLAEEGYLIEKGSETKA